MRVFVYRNLRKQCWSIKALEGPRRGRVVGHCSTVWLRDVTFRVSAAGRARVLRERRKNVHAGCVGTWDSGSLTPDSPTWERVVYNPYKYDSFVVERTDAPVAGASIVWMDHRDVVAWGVR